GRGRTCRMPETRMAAGYDEIDHINRPMIGWLLAPREDTRTPLRLAGMSRAADLDLRSDKVRRTVALMRERGIAQATTAVILERLMLSRAGTVAPGDRAYLDHMPTGHQRYRKQSFVHIPDERTHPQSREAFVLIP